jgi:hypothetical protein
MEEDTLLCHEKTKRKKKKNAVCSLKSRSRFKNNIIFIMRSQKKPESPLGVYLIILTLQAQNSAPGVDGFLFSSALAAELSGQRSPCL